MWAGIRSGVVTVHRGARDDYQVARALSEIGLLEALVTDLYWPADRPWARRVERLLPRRISARLRRRHAPLLRSDPVQACWASGAYAFALDKMPLVPFRWRRDAIRGCDRRLGRRAAEIATLRHAALLSYSYYAHSAFSCFNSKEPRILFQLHPHPASVRAILQQELARHPECRTSLKKEWELALTQKDFSRLIEETKMPDHWLVASSFTKQTLVENGVPGERVRVIPYGTDLQRFSPGTRKPAHPLRLLFCGTICQRKGIAYLLEALDLLPCGSAELTVCGRIVDDLSVFQNRRVPARVRPFLTSGELLDAYRSSDVFVLPSLAEGFGHVLLEAMACGLPIISTTRTAAPDLICHGQQGFVTEPGNAGELARCIEHFLRDPSCVTTMGEAARKRAEYFTWERFRSQLAATVRGILQECN